MTDTPDDYLDRNKAAWSEVADVHAAHRMRTLTQAFSKPGYTIFGTDPEHEVISRRLRQVGFAGKRVAQIGCNNGREILSALNEGAQSAVGFDLTPKFLDQGRGLAEVAGLADRIDWIEANAMALPADYDGQFDMIFTTIGVLGWLKDLDKFFDGLARYVKPGGHYVMEEIHPVALMWDEAPEGGMKPMLSYFGGYTYVGTGDLDYYEGTDYGGQNSNYSFPHTTAEIINLAAERGFFVTGMDELANDIGNSFPGVEEHKANPPLGLVLVFEKRA